MHRSALARAVVVGATLVISCVASPIAFGSDVEIDVDSESAGGDGVAGQVIGTVSPGRSVVVATSQSSHTTGIGGDARTSSAVQIFGLGSGKEGPSGSAESAGGDGIATQISGVGASTTTAEGSVQDPDGPLTPFLLVDIAP